MISGTQVDAWGALVPERIDLIEKLKEDVAKEVANRQIPNLTVSTEELGIGTTTQALIGEKREHIVFEQKLGGGALAAVALRIAPRGEHDMEISWRLFESNLIKGIATGTTQWGLVIFGGIWSLLSIALMPLGVGFCTFIIGPVIMGFGLGWWGKDRGKSNTTLYQKLDSRALAQAIDYSLMRSLEKLGITHDELRILVAAQMEGIGKLPV